MAKRISFIDLAKGFCIILVVMIHVGVPEYIPGLYAAKVPIFFVLSGLFFLKSSSNNGGFIIKRINTILIPFVLYYILSYALFYGLNYFAPNLIISNIKFSIIDVFVQRNLFNGPLWFLLCLFEVEIMFWMIYTYVKTEYIRALLVCLLGLVGFMLSSNDIFLPCWIDTSCVAIVYFYLGYLLSYSKYLSKKISYIWLLIAGILLYCIFLIFPVGIYMSTNDYTNNWLAVISGSAMVLVILIVCKMIDNAKLIEWFGANSMILLCTHHIIYRPIKYFQISIGNEQPLILFTSTMLIEIIVIYIINRFIPILSGKYSFINYSLRISHRKI